MKNKSLLRSLAIVLGLALALAGCGKKFTLKAVKVGPARVESTVTTINSGTVDAEQQAVLGFSGVGRVERVSVRIGDRVNRGQLIAELENTDLKTILEDSESELKRSQELFSSGLVSKVALDQAKKSYEIARANLDKSVIRAPFDGMITELNLQQGELASATTTKTPVRIVDLRPRIVKGNIDELDLAKVKVGFPARIKILAVSSERFGATVSKVIPFVNTTKEQDRTSAIELKIQAQRTPSGAPIPVGASADVEIVVSSKDQALAVPARTVLGVGEGKYVYLHRDGAIRRTPIKLGIGNYERSEVLSGVKEGDIVVFPSDVAELKEGLKVNVEVSPWP